MIKVCIVPIDSKIHELSRAMEWDAITLADITYTLILHGYVYERKSTQHLFNSIHDTHYHKIVEGRAELTSLHELNNLHDFCADILPIYQAYFDKHMGKYCNYRVCECHTDSVGNLHILYAL